MFRSLFGGSNRPTGVPSSFFAQTSSENVVRRYEPSAPEIDLPEFLEIENQAELEEIFWSAVITMATSRSSPSESIEISRKRIVNDLDGQTPTGITLQNVSFSDCSFAPFTAAYATLKSVGFQRCDFDASSRFDGCFFDHVSFSNCAFSRLLFRSAAISNKKQLSAADQKARSTIVSTVKNDFPTLFEDELFREHSHRVELSDGELLRTAIGTMRFNECYFEYGPDFHATLVGNIDFNSCAGEWFWFETCAYRLVDDKLEVDFVHAVDGDEDAQTTIKPIVKNFAVHNCIFRGATFNQAIADTIRFKSGGRRWQARNATNALVQLSLRGCKVKRLSLNAVARSLTIEQTSFREVSLLNFSSDQPLRLVQDSTEQTQLERGRSEAGGNDQANSTKHKARLLIDEFNKDADDPTIPDPQFRVNNVTGRILKFRSCEIRVPELKGLQFERVIFEDVQFDDGQFLDLRFAEGTMNATEFRDISFNYCQLNGIDFRETKTDQKKISVDFYKSQFENVDFANSNLFGASFIETVFSGGENKFREVVSLDYANFDGASGLNLKDFSGLDLRGVKLPDALQLDRVQNAIEQISRNGQRIFFILAVLLGFSLLVTINLAFPDEQLNVGNDQLRDVSPLPWLNLELSVRQFYLFFPTIILSVYAYFHVFISRLWSDISLLPAIMPDGRPADKTVYPWVISSLSRFFVPSRIRKRKTAGSELGLEPIVALIVGYIATPLTLGFMAYTVKSIEVYGVLLPSIGYFLASTVISIWFFSRIGVLIGNGWK